MKRQKKTQSSCAPKDIALKSFFLGPQAENAGWLRDLVAEVLEHSSGWRRSLYPEDGSAVSKLDQSNEEFKSHRKAFRDGVYEILRRYEREVPKFSPRYIGHMFSETSLPALLGHLITLLHNPNNISGEVSRVGVKIEDEAIAAIAKMLGYPVKAAMGHFTSGGTVANFEALFRARERAALWVAAESLREPRAKRSFFEAAHMGWITFAELTDSEEIQARLDESVWTEWGSFEARERLAKIFPRGVASPVVLVPENKHYSWNKGVSLLGLGGESFWSVDLDREGRLCVDHLGERIEEARAKGRPVLMVVSVAGTTEMGVVDPIDQVSRLLDRYEKQGIHIWHHVDAAYGGFFCSMGKSALRLLGPGVTRSLAAIASADSVTIDPHKLAYVPYSSGAFLCKDPRDYYVRAFGSPYIQCPNPNDRGPFTIEGSRSAAGATATWMVERCVGFHKNGLGRILARTVMSREKLVEAMRKKDPNVRIAPHGDTNILCFCVARKGEALRRTNQRTLALYDAFSPARQSQFFVSKTTLQWSSYRNYLESFFSDWGAKRDADELVLIRLALMNPFFDSVEMQTDFSEEFASMVAKLGGKL